MKFEYDNLKSGSNFKKHGIDFEDAQAIWWDRHALVDIPARTTEEPRFAAIGRIREKLWIAIYTYRGTKKNTLRVISVRRARENEEKAYYEKIQNQSF